MKYRNAMELLPPQLMHELQRYAQGEVIYVPKVKRTSWGEGTGAKTFYSRRDADIRTQYSRGTAMGVLGEEYFLSEDAVKKIIYKKGAMGMNADENKYKNYFWQDELIRVRRSRPEDWEYNHSPGYDSDERFFSDYAQELPNSDELSKEAWENYVNANQNSDERILFAFETHDGEYVGGGNLYGIDERNGTFGMFVGGVAEKYVIAGAKLLLEYAFNERRLNNCHTGVIENDTIYKPVFEKLGFKLEGVRRQQLFHKGKYWNECLYGMLAEEFNAQK